MWWWHATTKLILFLFFNLVCTSPNSQPQMSLSLAQVLSWSEKNENTAASLWTTQWCFFFFCVDLISFSFAESPAMSQKAVSYNDNYFLWTRRASHRCTFRYLLKRTDTETHKYKMSTLARSCWRPRLTHRCSLAEGVHFRGRSMNSNGKNRFEVDLLTNLVTEQKLISQDTTD